MSSDRSCRSDHHTKGTLTSASTVRGRDAPQRETTPGASRGYWLHVATGAMRIGDRELAAGDALGFLDESRQLQLEGIGEGDAEVLMFDLPR